MFVGYQAYIYKKDYYLKNKKNEIEKAIQLAEVYANEIIYNIQYLLIVYSRLGITKIIDDVKSSKMCQFDNDELDELLNIKQQDEIKRKLSKIESDILLKARQAFIRKKEINLIDKISYYVIPSDNNIKPEIINSILNDEFDMIKCETLNKLEYFCMNFNSGIANDKMVYQSLHQTFLRNVKFLYFDIALLNKSGKDKYYTNIIKLFNKWNSIYLDAHRKEVKIKRSQTVSSIEVKV